MRRLAPAFCTIVVCCTVILVLGVMPAQAKDKTCLCHNGHTICVGSPAVKAHQNHGDTLGACPVPCGGSAGNTCHADQFCKRDAGVCSADAEGVCTARPATCPAESSPVCGCDGTTYDSACAADLAGVSLAHAGACGGTCEPTGCGGAGGGTCADGEFCKRPDGACGADAEGTCDPVPATCAPDQAPVCGCDGQTYDNACFADSAGVAVQHTGACAQGTACGGQGGAVCATGEFCKPPEGECTAGAAGSCAPIPPLCSKITSPVCGCNGTSYGNACLADQASVGVDHEGRCAADVVACGGAAPACPTGQVCIRPPGSGCDPAVPGVCAPASPDCPSIIDPVCGCDGKSYGNACVALAAGVAIDHEGVCVPVQACGAAGNPPCDTGQFCLKPAGTCAVADQAGVCATLPTLCLTPVVQVCGCDAITYNNACLAAAAGVNVNHTGACP